MHAQEQEGFGSPARYYVVIFFFTQNLICWREIVEEEVTEDEAQSVWGMIVTEVWIAAKGEFNGNY